MVAKILSLDLDISIHAPLRERLKPVLLVRGYQVISIHAPLRERLLVEKYAEQRQKISIHAPLRERLHIIVLRMDDFVFQSTLPYGSDVTFLSAVPQLSDFNPRSLTGAT